MEKEILLRELNHISKVYFNKKDYISSGQVNRAIDVVEDYYAGLSINCEHNRVKYSEFCNGDFCQDCGKPL